VVPNVKNPPKHKFALGDFMSLEVSANSHNFRFRLPALHIQNLSNRCRHNYDQSISQNFESRFWRVLQYDPTVRAGALYTQDFHEFFTVAAQSLQHQ
jgi:hypothetical protein